LRAIAHRIRANGLTHFVRDTGDEDAPVALLLHGFPDTSAIWNEVTPLLVAGGYRVLAPDLRGFGETDIPTQVSDYDIPAGACADIMEILDKLSIKRAHIVGHDFGAPVAWSLAALHPDRFISLAALSVGHARAYLKAGAEQKRRSLYILVHQFRGICEWLYRRNDLAMLRKPWSGLRHIDETLTMVSRPGRLTAGLNWYRANISLRRMFFPPKPGELGEERVKIPTLGVWSDGDPYLVEAQMTGSSDFVDAPWTYDRIEGASHWLQADAPDRLSALLLRHWKAAESG